MLVEAGLNIEKYERQEKEIELQIKKETEILQKKLSDKIKDKNDLLNSIINNKDVHILKRFSFWKEHSNKEESSYVSLPFGLDDLYSEFSGGNENELHPILDDVINEVKYKLNEKDNSIPLYNESFFEKDEVVFNSLTKKLQKELTLMLEDTIMMNSENIRFD